MTTLNDFLFIPEANVEEDAQAGISTKAALFMTTHYIFMLPRDEESAKTQRYIDQLVEKASLVATENIEDELLHRLDNDYIFEVKNLDQLSVDVGFWIFGGMRLRRRGDQTKAISIRTAEKRKAIKQFYKL